MTYLTSIPRCVSLSPRALSGKEVVLRGSRPTRNPWGPEQASRPSPRERSAPAPPPGVRRSPGTSPRSVGQTGPPRAAGAFVPREGGHSAEVALRASGARPHALTGGELPRETTPPAVVLLY